MITFGYLNQDSINRIRNIEMDLKNNPLYSSYQIRYYIYDSFADVHALEISKNGAKVNLWLFYPDVSNNGKIGSIALYGLYLQGHYNAIKSSMTVFDISVSDISFDSGLESFLDIYLNY